MCCTRCQTDTWLFLFSISVNNFLFLPHVCETVVSWVIFLSLYFSPIVQLCQHCCLSLKRQKTPKNWFLSLFQAPPSFFWGPVKKITSSMRMGFDTCLYVFISERKACLCTWHWVCPCFLAETGEISWCCHCSISPTFSRIYARDNIWAVGPQLSQPHYYLILCPEKPVVKEH